MRRRQLWLKKGLAAVLSAAMVLTSVPSAVMAAAVVPEDVAVDETGQERVSASENLVARYTFDDETVNNVVGTDDAATVLGRNLAAYSGAVSYDSGRDGKALKVGDYGIELNKKNLGTDYTVSMWVKPTETYPENQVMLFLGYHNPERWLSISGMNGTSSLKVWAHGGTGDLRWQTLLDPAPVLNADGWHKVTMTGTEGVLNMYVDGVSAGTANNSNNPLVGENQDIYIAVNNWDSQFSGLVDDVEVYKTALTADEIAAAYAAEKDVLLVNEAAAALTLGDTTAVTENIQLPTSSQDVAISWATSDAAVVAADGTVTRPAADATVTLTATLTKGEASTTKVFQVTVLKADDAEEQTDLALFATPAASYTSSWENLNGINNPDFEPENSNFGTNKGWGNWSQAEGTVLWVSYTWDSAKQIKTNEVYWYDDGGDTGVPSEMTMEYLDFAGEWQPVTITSENYLNKDQYNTIDIKPVTTTSIRMNVTVATGKKANGVGRWKVYGAELSDEEILAEELNVASGLSEKDYTADSWSALQTAINNAYGVILTGQATADEIKAAQEQLEAALAGLEQSTVARDNLSATITSASAYTNDDGKYTAESFALLQKAIADGQKVVADENADNAALNAARTAIEDAVTALTIDPVYAATQNLNAAIKAANRLKESIYSAESWAVLTAAVAAAEEVAAKEGATVEEMNAAISAITDAMSALEVNPAYLEQAATPTASKTSSWEYLEGIKDMSFEPTTSSFGTGKGWGCWAVDEGSTQWVTYTWDNAVTLDTNRIYWYDDGGGTRVPASITFEYMDGNGEWQQATIATTDDYFVTDQYNLIQFDQPITTTALRLNMVVRSGAAAVGIGRWKVSLGIPEEPEAEATAERKALGSVLETVKTLNEVDYTPESWAALQSVVADAQATYENTNTTNGLLSLATQDVIDAIGELVPAEGSSVDPVEADKTALNAVVAAAEGLQESVYTADSWKALADALAEAKKITEDASATQAQVTAASQAVVTAVGALKAAEEVTPTPTPTPTPAVNYKGKTFTSNNLKYKVTSHTSSTRTVTVTGWKKSKSSVTIPATVTYKKVTFKVTKINKGAFKNKTAMKSVSIGKNVKSIGAYAFYGCKKLTSIKIKGKLLTSVGKSAFKKIPKKAVIKVSVKSKKSAYKKLLKGKTTTGVTIK